MHMNVAVTMSLDFEGSVQSAYDTLKLTKQSQLHSNKDIFV